MAELKSEKDVLAENKKLTEDLSAANSRISTLESSNTTLMRERDDSRTTASASNDSLRKKDSDLSAVTQERDSLRSENATLKAGQADFDAKLAKGIAEGIAKHGINPKAVTNPPSAKEQTTSTQAGGSTVVGKNYTELAAAAIAGGATGKITVK